jgi:hypothetical protein
MAVPRYPIGRFPSGRRVSFVELALAVSVIVGLGFVSIRIKNADWTQAAASRAAEVQTVAASTTPDTPVEKTP